jgi:hypothetical protein
MCRFSTPAVTVACANEAAKPCAALLPAQACSSARPALGTAVAAELASGLLRAAPRAGRPRRLQALTPLTIGRSHVKGALLGALWGFGHSIGQLLLGLLMVVLKARGLRPCAPSYVLGSALQAAGSC